MDKWQRKILVELCDLCNMLGGELDYTATHYNKLKDRQRSLMDCYKVLYGVLTKHPENESWEDQKEEAVKSLEKMKSLLKITYPDRNG